MCGYYIEGFGVWLLHNRARVMVVGVCCLVFAIDCHMSTGFSGEDTGGGEGEGFAQQDHGEGEGGWLGVGWSTIFSCLCLQEIIFHREKVTELSRAIETLKEDIRYIRESGISGISRNQVYQGYQVYQGIRDIRYIRESGISGSSFYCLVGFPVCRSPGVLCSCVVQLCTNVH